MPLLSHSTMNYLDMSCSATSPTRGSSRNVLATRLSSQRDIPQGPRHPRRGSEKSACIAVPSMIRQSSFGRPGADSRARKSALRDPTQLSHGLTARSGIMASVGLRLTDSNGDSNVGSQLAPLTHDSIQPRSGLITRTGGPLRLNSGRSVAGEPGGQALAHWEPRWEPPGRTTFWDSGRR